jgi:hypothetical protein
MRRLAQHLRLALAVLALAACSAEEPVTDADKALFLRVADLAQFGVRYPNAEAAESFAKARQVDGSYEITYNFEVSGDARPLYLHGSVNIGRTSTDATLAESAEKIGLLVAFKRSGVEEREVPACARASSRCWSRTMSRSATSLRCATATSRTSSSSPACT